MPHPALNHTHSWLQGTSRGLWVDSATFLKTLKPWIEWFRKKVCFICSFCFVLFFWHNISLPRILLLGEDVNKLCRNARPALTLLSWNFFWIWLLQWGTHTQKSEEKQTHNLTYAGGRNQYFFEESLRIILDILVCEGMNQEMDKSLICPRYQLCSSTTQRTGHLEDLSEAYFIKTELVMNHE